MTKTKESAMASLLDGDEPKTPRAPEPQATIAPPPPVVPPIASKDTKNAPVSSRVADLRSSYDRTKRELSASLGLSPRYLPPIMKGKVAIYQLIGFKGRIDPRVMDDGTANKLIEPQPYELSPSYNFYDADETDLASSTKVITYYEGNELVYMNRLGTDKKDAVSQRKLGNPHFRNGQVVVDIYKEYGKYVWWELHPQNKSNKHRDTNRHDLVFERVDTKFESPHTKLIRMDLARDAEDHVRKLDAAKLINLGSALTNPTIDVTVSIQELRLTLRTRARKNPEEILFTSHDKTASTKLNVIHALDMGIITFDPGRETYMFRETKTDIFQVPIDNPPLDTFAKYLLTQDGEEDRTIIEDMLSFWY